MTGNSARAGGDRRHATTSGSTTGSRWLLVAIVALVILVVGACRSSTTTQAPSAGAESGSAPAIASDPAVSPSLAAISSPTPSPTLPAPASPTAAGPHLTYVALGDSLLYALAEDCRGCTSAAVLYGRQLETDLGSLVEVHNLTMHNGLDSAGLLGYLTDGALVGRDPEDILAAVAAADIVSVSIGIQ